MKKILVALLTVVMLIGMSSVSFASPASKAVYQVGDTVDTVRYNVATGSYVYGTAVIKNRKPDGSVKAEYPVIDESTFTEAQGEVSDSIKEKISLVEEKTNYVFNNYQINLTRFGRVDSESSPYNVAVSPIVVPILEAAGFAQDENIWLAMGDRAGTVTDVYMTVAQSDIDDGAERVQVSVVVPRRMSVRLENGSVLKNGDSFTVKIGQTVRFQMCSNNWDTDTYSDGGNGLAGTVVYSVRVSDSYTERSYDPATHTFVLPKGDRVLRTDVNSCFMAYRFHFAAGDYNRQTGIAGVVNTPLESLSVNLPLGSTVTCDAYNAMEKTDTAYIFVMKDADETLSYTDYFWNN